MVRILPPRLTSQKLAKFLGEIDAVWIIEDFHKVPNEEKKENSRYPENIYRRS